MALGDLAAGVQAPVEALSRSLLCDVNVELVDLHPGSDSRQQSLEPGLLTLEFAFALAPVAGRLADRRNL